MLTVLAGIVFVVFFRRKGKIAANNDTENPSLAGIVQIFAIIYFASAIIMDAASPYSTGGVIVLGLQTDWFRYSAPLVPLSAVFLGLGIPKIGDAFSEIKWRWVINGLAFWLLIDLAGAFGIQTYALYAKHKTAGAYGKTGLPFFRHHQITNLLTDLHVTFGFSRQDLLERVAIIYPKGGDMGILSRSAEHLIAQMEIAAERSDQPGCILVVSRFTDDPYQRRDKAEIDRILKLIGEKGAVGLPAPDFVSLKLVMRDDYVMIRYQPSHLNCARSLQNDFIMTAKEKQTLDFLNELPAGIAVTKVPERKADHTAYVGRVPMLDEGYPLTFMVEIAYEANGEMYWILRSKQLRNGLFASSATITASKGKVGYLEPTFVDNAKIIFEGADGVKSEFSIFEGRLGILGTLTPWRSSSQFIKPGVYRVSLKIAALGRREGARKEVLLELDPALKTGK